MQSIIRRGSLAVLFALTFGAHAALAQSIGSDTKICDALEWDPGGPAYKAFCWANDEMKYEAGRAEAFDDGHIHVNVYPLCHNDWDTMRCEVSGNFVDWVSLNEGADKDVWWSRRVPLIAMACFCGPWQPETGLED
jgi:hypothetical protein